MEWTTISLHHWWWVYFQGQKGQVKASWATFWPLLKFFFENSLRSIQKLLEFEKNVFKKDYPRPAAFKTTFRFGINFLWSYSSELNQIQTIWLFDQKFIASPLFWPLKAKKAKKGPITFFSLTQPNKILLQSHLF